MSTHAARRTSRLSRFAALFRHDDARPQRLLVPVGMPGSETAMYFRPDPDQGPACKACSPLDFGRCTCPKDCGHLSCTGGWRGVPPLAETEPWGPPCDRPDGLLMNGADLTDGRIVPGYIPGHPGRRSPDVAADLAALPLFREAVERRTRHGARECLCGHQLNGQAWGERMVRAGMHLTGMDASRILDAAPHLTIPAAVALSDEEAAA